MSAAAQTDTGRPRSPAPTKESHIGPSASVQTDEPTNIQTDKAPDQTSAPSGDPEGAPVCVVQQLPYQPSFKERVVGHAKDIRGTVLRKRETKEYGEKILKGEASFNPKQ
ncbi:hypothetical protein AcW1_007357 [Taiwanofungus camphoratus]|nr:hypothetical protein AcW2_007575 [Antrodia cinnamomea]KAI0920068.1 hypothetical protein AcV7_006068 [Antrodia cinnamomea]KAI0927378.1 hypothetical protein AcV5_007931 [Antrodia cinnamomea]KAI0953033.1 hypothetical protein AcW1_007357 [Antrodia cinnamomea]